MLVVISSSEISTPFTVAATPPVRPDADSLDEHAAMPHMQAAASPAAQATLMIRAVFIWPFPMNACHRGCGHCSLAKRIFAHGKMPLNRCARSPLLLHRHRHIAAAAHGGLAANADGACGKRHADAGGVGAGSTASSNSSSNAEMSCLNELAGVGRSIMGPRMECDRARPDTGGARKPSGKRKRRWRSIGAWNLFCSRRGATASSRPSCARLRRGCACAGGCSRGSPRRARRPRCTRAPPRA